MGQRVTLAVTILLVIGLLTTLSPARKLDRRIQDLQRRQSGSFNTMNTSITVQSSSTMMISATMSQRPSSTTSTTPFVPTSTSITSATVPIFTSSTSSPSATMTITSSTPTPTTSSTPSMPTSSTTATDSSSPSATSVRTYTSALYGTSDSQTVVLTTRTVGGTAQVESITTSTPVRVTTGHVTATDPAELAAAANHSGGGGISSSTQKIIGGVVGGIGGALLLGVIGVVLWRLRKKRAENALADDDDAAYAVEDKRFSGGSTQPLSDGTERYRAPHTNPTTSVNTSSNF